MPRRPRRSTPRRRRSRRGPPGRACPRARSHLKRSRRGDFCRQDRRCQDLGTGSRKWTLFLGLIPAPRRGPRGDHVPDLRPDATEELTRALEGRILVLDGAMGTAIQRDRPDEAGYRGERFADWPSDLVGNNDLLTLTQPEIIGGIHREYLEAGADIIETNTFNANAVSLSDYGMEELAYELNYESARLARREADAVATPDRPRYVAGA